MFSFPFCVKVPLVSKFSRFLTLLLLGFLLTNLLQNLPQIRSNSDQTVPAR